MPARPPPRSRGDVQGVGDGVGDRVELEDLVGVGVRDVDPTAQGGHAVDDESRCASESTSSTSPVSGSSSQSWSLTNELTRNRLLPSKASPSGPPPTGIGDGMVRMTSPVTGSSSRMLKGSLDAVAKSRGWAPMLPSTRRRPADLRDDQVLGRREVAVALGVEVGVAGDDEAVARTRIAGHLEVVRAGGRGDEVGDQLADVRGRVGAPQRQRRPAGVEQGHLDVAAFEAGQGDRGALALPELEPVDVGLVGAREGELGDEAVEEIDEAARFGIGAVQDAGRGGRLKEVRCAEESAQFAGRAADVELDDEVPSARVVVEEVVDVDDDVERVRRPRPGAREGQRAVIDGTTPEPRFSSKTGEAVLTVVAA